MSEWLARGGRWLRRTLSNYPPTYAGCRYRWLPHAWGTWAVVDRPTEGPGLSIFQKRRCKICGIEQWHRQLVYL